MFQDALQLRLDLSIKGDVFRIAGGDIMDFRVNLDPYGFDAKVEFRVYSDTAEDKLLKRFSDSDLIDAALSIQAVYHLPQPTPDPMLVKGLVTKKFFRETDFVDVRGNPVYLRNYTIAFRDPARVLWTQHFPTVLYADASMKKVIQAQVPDGMWLDIDWLAINDEKPMYFLSLGDGDYDSSFYDFLMSYVKALNGVFTYDTQSQAYYLTGSKKSFGEKQTLNLDEFADYSFCVPEACRHHVRLLNIYSENPKNIPVPNTKGVNDVFRDVLVRRETPAALALDALNEAPKMASPTHEIRLVMNRYPVVPFYPGVICDFSKGEASRNIFAHDKNYRVRRIRLNGSAEKKGRDDDRGGTFKSYTCGMTAVLEMKDEPGVALPRFKTPRYPLSVEGRIVSDVGEDTDKTYQFYEGKTTKETYKVFVPLWNKTIPVPYEPITLPAHFYFPAYKHSRVLLDLYFDRAAINRYLDWGADVRLPMDTQGNHILMGKNETTNISINHVYRDGKPELNAKRIHGKDSGILKMEEGRMVLEVKEDTALPGAEKRFDVTPKAVAAMAKSSMSIESAKDGVRDDYDSTSNAVTGELNAAVSRTKGALDKMDAEMAGKTQAIAGKVEAAAQEMAKKAEVLTSKVKQLSAELKAKISL